MKIVYDHQVFSWQEYGGISRYIYEVATRTAKADGFDVKIIAGVYVNKYLRNCSSLVVGLPVPEIPKTSKIRTKFNDEISSFWLQKHPPDIVHETYYHSRRLAPKNTKTVITVHDMIHEKFSHLFHPKDNSYQVKIESVRQADHIICVSNNTKKDLIEILNVVPNKVSVIYHGCSFKVDDFHQLDVGASCPYILYVGDRGRYKNFQRLLQAYASSSKLRNNFNLVCFGSHSLHREELSIINALELPENKVLHFSGDDVALANFYRGASIFVYPSLYEGFGIPLLEAMSLHCPIACSNTSSMPEVVGNAAELFDPYEPESIANALEKVLYLSARAEELVKLGTERIKRFSWEACAEQTRQLYLSLG